MSDQTKPSTELLKEIIKENQSIVIICLHLSGLIFSFLPSLIIYIFNRNKVTHLKSEAIKAFNFQFTILIISIFTWIENYLPVTIPLQFLVFLIMIVPLGFVVYNQTREIATDYKIAYPFIKG